MNATLVTHCQSSDSAITARVYCDDAGEYTVQIARQTQCSETVETVAGFLGRLDADDLAESVCGESACVLAFAI